MKKNYKPEVESLIATLNKHGVEIFSVSNGDQYMLTSRMSYIEMVDEIMGSDCAWLKLKHGGEFFRMFLVFGNSPGELICDHTDINPLYNVADEHGTIWEGKKQPMF